MRWCSTPAAVRGRSADRCAHARSTSTGRTSCCKRSVVAAPVARAVVGDLARLPVRDGATQLVHVGARPAVDRRSRRRAGGAPPRDEPGRMARGDRHRLGHVHRRPPRRDRRRSPVGGRARPGCRTRASRATCRRSIGALGARDLRVRHDTATITAWDPDDPAQHDGPPGLPLHSIAGAHAAELDVVAAPRPGRRVPRRGHARDVHRQGLTGAHASFLSHPGVMLEPW